MSRESKPDTRQGAALETRDDKGAGPSHDAVAAARYRRWPGASTVAVVLAILVIAVWWLGGD